MNKERQGKPAAAKRNYKDTLFRMVFCEPEALLSLYNAVNGTDYRDASELKIVTLENAIYMNMKNDLAFLIDFRLEMYEHQASVNPNMPLRHLIYVAREYQGLLNEESLYSSKRVMLPTPHFVVFYNGRTEQPDRLEMKLSDAFEVPEESPVLELKVIQLNIQAGHNETLMKKCPILKQYAQYVERVQKYAEKKHLNEAVEQAVQECIREGILVEFLLKNRAEAIEMSIFEYDEEKELALLRKAEREVGREEGREEGRDRILVGQVCKKLRKGLEAERIAEELETKVEVIKNICEKAAVYAPEYDDESVYEACHK